MSPIELLNPPAEIAGDSPPKKRGPGRPKGSKNKPKDPFEEAGKAAAGNGDDAPTGGGRRRRKRISKKVTEDIEQALAEILTAPSMVAAVQGDQWAVEHFITNGKELAARVAHVSERHSQLRAWCESLLEGESYFLVGMAGLAYVLPALIHYNMLPVPDGTLGVPKRPKKSGRNGQRFTGSPTDGTDWRQSGRTAQQEYEAEQADYPDDILSDEGIEFGGDGDDGPPTFVEV